MNRTGGLVEGKAGVTLKRGGGLVEGKAGVTSKGGGGLLSLRLGRWGGRRRGGDWGSNMRSSRIVRSMSNLLVRVTS